MTIVTVRPNATSFISNPFTGWTYNGTGSSADLSAYVANIANDNSDTTYVEAGLDGQFLNYHFGNYTLAANERCNSVTVRIRGAKSPTVNFPESLITRLYTYKGSTNSGFIMSYTATRGSTITTTSSGKAKFADGHTEWTQAKISGLGLQCEWDKPHIALAPDLAMFRLREVYLDLEILHAPTVSGAPTVTNFTNDSTPTVAWTFNDPDGGTQRAYRVKVFTQAIHDAANFNPDTSLASWDSGDIVGGDPTIDVATSLQNATNYYAYVKVAKDGVANDKYWWSAWSGSTLFQVTFTPPYTPAMTATVLSDSNQYRALLTTLVPLNVLTIDNASFETAIGQWTALANCAVVRDTAQHADGVASMKMTSTASGDMTAVVGLDFVGNPRVDVGETITAVASFHASTAARSCAVGVQWLDATNAIISTVFGSSVTDSTSAGVWTQASFTGVAPALAIHAKPVVKVIATGAGAEVHWVDKVDIHAGSQVSWTPGGYTNDQTNLYIERGEILDSARGPAENWIHAQCHGGMLTRNAGQGFSWSATSGDLRWMWLDKALSGNGNPAGMLRWTGLLNSGAPVIDIGQAFYGGTDYSSPCAPNQTHVFSLWAWTDSGTATVAVKLTWRDATATFISSTTGSNVTLTTTPQQIVVTGTAPSNALLVSGGLIIQTHDVDKHIYFTKCGLGLGTLPVDHKQPKGTTISWDPIKFIGSQDVAYLSGFPPGFSTGQTVAYPDYEYTSGRPCLYRASITYSTSGITIISAYSYAVAYAAPPAVTLLRSVVNPYLQVAVARRKDGTFTFSDDSQIFHPIGADAGPIKVRDWASGEDGAIEIITSTETQAARLRDLIRSNDTLMIQWGQGGKTYIQITSVSTSETYSADADFCDADGFAASMRYDVTSLSYIETVAP